MGAGIESYTLIELANASGLENLYTGKESLYAVDYVKQGSEYKSLYIYGDLQDAIRMYEGLTDTGTEKNIFKCYYDAVYKRLNRLVKIR